MSKRISQEQKIALLKMQCEGERLILAKQAGVILPNATAIALIGASGLAAAKALPILNPLVARLSTRVLSKAKIGSAGWLKIAGVMSVGIALSRLLSRRPE